MEDFSNGFSCWRLILNWFCSPESRIYSDFESHHGMPFYRGQLDYKLLWCRDHVKNIYTVSSTTGSRFMTRAPRWQCTTNNQSHCYEWKLLISRATLWEQYNSCKGMPLFIVRRILAKMNKSKNSTGSFLRLKNNLFLSSNITQSCSFLYTICICWFW